jgi:aspartate racemase
VFDANSIAYVAPDDLQRAQMDKVIQRLVEGQHLNKDREVIMNVAKDLSAKNVDCVALACTDLQLLLPDSSEVPVFDTMKILSTSTVDMILA